MLPDNIKQYCVMASAGFTITIPENHDFDKSFLLGVLNSKLLYWFLKNMSNIFRGGWITCTKQYVGLLPIIKINSNNQTDIKLHGDIVQCVNKIMELNRIKNPNKGLLSHLEEKIDKLVYMLYGLTENEVKTIEEVVNGK